MKTRPDEGQHAHKLIFEKEIWIWAWAKSDQILLAEIDRDLEQSKWKYIAFLNVNFDIHERFFLGL